MSRPSDSRLEILGLGIFSNSKYSYEGILIVGTGTYLLLLGFIFMSVALKAASRV